MTYYQNNGSDWTGQAVRELTQHYSGCGFYTQPHLRFQRYAGN